jgi:CheY-like chemotaxis protein
LGKSILIVDDEPDIRTTLAGILGALGYATRIASNGQDAIDNIRAHGVPALIILDLMMPTMNGYQFLAVQRQDATLAHIPVVVITAGASPRREELHPHEVVPKPLNLPVLLKLVAKAVSQSD